jgi:hypothetical protein
MSTDEQALRVAFPAAAALSAAFAAAALGAEQTEIAEYAFELSPGSQTVQIAKFDDQAGARELKSVSVRLEVEIGADVQAENTQFLPSEDVAVQLNGNINASIGHLYALVRLDASYYADAPVGGSDGKAGGPDLFNFGYLDVYDSDEVTADADLHPFVGNGTIDAYVAGTAAFLPHAEYETWDWTVENFGASGRVIVTYDFDDTAPCPNDITNDGHVDFSDVLAVLEAWGNCPVIALCPEDTHPDGKVDALDLFAVLASMGACH